MNTQKRNEAICRKNGFHTWTYKNGNCEYFPAIESSCETLTDIDVELTCQICGATASGSLDWSEPEEHDDWGDED